MLSQQSMFFYSWCFKGLCQNMQLFIESSRRWRCVFEPINSRLSSAVSMNTPLWLREIHFSRLVIRTAQVCVPQGGGEVIAYGPISCPALLANIAVQYCAAFTPRLILSPGIRDSLMGKRSASQQGQGLSTHHKEKRNSSDVECYVPKTGSGLNARGDITKRGYLWE